MIAVPSCIIWCGVVLTWTKVSLILSYLWEMWLRIDSVHATPNRSVIWVYPRISNDIPKYFDWMFDEWNGNHLHSSIHKYVSSVTISRKNGHDEIRYVILLAKMPQIQFVTEKLLTHSVAYMKKHYKQNCNGRWKNATFSKFYFTNWKLLIMFIIDKK